MPSRIRKFGLQTLSWMLAAPTTGPQYRCGAICTCCTSAIRGDLLRLENAADAPQVHLQNRRRPGAQYPREVVLGGEPLAGGDRDARAARHPRHLLGRIRRHRLLEPQRIVGLEAPCQPQRSRSGHLPVGAEQQIGTRADGGAQLPHEALGELERRQRELPPVERRVRARRIELQRREPLREIFRGTLGGEIRVLVDVGAVTGTRVDVGVGAQPLVHTPAEQVVHRLVRLPCR